MNASVIELIGYIGSALVLVSFLMTSVVRLRVINAIGSLIFAIYALIIHSYPTMLMNICLVLINLRFLWRLRGKAPDYHLLRLSPQESFIDCFLQEHQQDIASFFPNRRWERQQLNCALMVCHGDTLAGLLLGKEQEGVLDVALDYSTPAYRDASVGHFLLKSLRGQVHLVRYTNPEPSHVEYLKKLGFVSRDDIYEKHLDA